MIARLGFRSGRAPGGAPSSDNLKGKAIFSAYAPKVPESRRDSLFGFPEPVLATVEMCDELTVLKAHYRLQVQAPHDGYKIQVICLAKLSWTQPVVAVVSGPMVLGTKRHSRGIRGLLSQAVRACVGQSSEWIHKPDKAESEPRPGMWDSVPASCL